MRLIECIPNFSEGRDMTVIEALAKTASSVPGVALADYSADADHNRSVFTIIGPPEGVEQTAFLLAETACALIDLNLHSGEHPRMGAADVIPFVPLKDTDMRECAAISRRVAERIGRELNIPVFLYEYSASGEHRKNLADIRRGGFERMAAKMRRPEWRPDFGPAAPHPTAGAVAVGARMPLIAFNINLNTGDLSVAENIAKRVRESGGGLKYCKAIGIMLESKNIAQVSMNMVNYMETPLHLAYEAVKAEAARYGVSVTGSEIIGLAPARALADCAACYMGIEGYSYQKSVLESYIQ